MSKFRETQGEWQYVPSSISAKHTYSIIADATFLVADIYKKPKNRLNQAEANAKLISAAPNLLAACQMAQEELCFGGDWKTAHRIIEEAIEKATK